MSKPIVLTPEEVAHFWSKVNVGAPDDCWTWQNAHDCYGYPIYHITSGWYKAHRVACFLAHGDAGALTCHNCNNPACVNPAHLYAGSAKSNIADREREGTTNRGGKHHLAKLTNEQVNLIVALIGTGKKNREVGEIVGVRRRLVERIRSGECWGWLTGFNKFT